jgi:hypothetical protein
MRRQLPWRLAAALGAVALLPACAGPAFSELVGERYFVTRLDTYPLTISSVDGRSSTLPVQYVEPGPRQLVLQGPPGFGGVTTLRSFELKVRPCIRYYIVAVRASPLDAEFTPRVDYEQALAGCRP